MSKIVKNLLLVTGMSGAGKSVALNCLEDIGYYCIDNMPPVLLKHISALTSENNLNYNNIENFAIVVDGRSQDFEGIMIAINELKNNADLNLNILFLECNDEVLNKRFKETRRLHPLSQQGSTSEGINFERKALRNIKEIADYVIDTSYISSNQLKREVAKRFEFKSSSFNINFMSFGFKHGSPIDCDFVFDVRFLPNPFYIEEMRTLTGLDQVVYEYVIEREDAQQFIEKVLSLLEFVIPKYESITKNQILIGIGCSGGQHRSVSIARKLNELLSEKFKTNVWHRDIEKARGH
jgi:RNase adapter protein RapZ